MTDVDLTHPIAGLDPTVAERIIVELGADAGERILRCLRTAQWLLRQVSDDESGLRLAESAVYNMREALDAVVRDKPAGEGGFSAAIEAWERYKLACGQPGADEAAARSELAETLDGLARDQERQAFMTRKLLEWFRVQTGVDPIRGDTDPTRQYQDLRDRASRIVHGSSSQAQAELLFGETVAWFIRFFTPPSETAERLDLLARRSYTPECLVELRSLATSTHHLRLFLERLEDAAWLEPMRAGGLLGLPTPGELWPVTALAGKTRLLPDADIVELLRRLLDDVRLRPRPERRACALEMMRAASWLGPAGHGIVLGVLKQYPAEDWAQMIAMAAAADVDDSDPIHFAVADAVIGKEPRRGHTDRTKHALAHLVDGMTSDNVEERFRLIANKARHLASDAEASYVVIDIAALTVVDADDREPLALVAHALAAVILAARSLGLSGQSMLELVEKVPGPWGERLVCQVFAGATDLDRAAKLAHLVTRLASRTASGDDKALLVDLAPLSDSEIVELRHAFGGPSPDPADGDRAPYGENWPRAWRWSMVLPADVFEGWEHAINAVTAVHGPPNPAALEHPIPSHVVSHGASPYETEDLATMDVLEAASVVATWRPSPQDPWGVSARELARSLETIVKESPEAWTRDPVEIVRTLREPVYIDHYFRALTAIAATVSADAPALIRAVDLVRAERWEPTVIGRDDFDYEADWTVVDTVVVEMIDALADADADLSADLDHCWALATERFSDLPSDLGTIDRYDERSSHDDPLHGAINSGYGKGLQAVLALGGWEHRNLGVAGSRLAPILSDSLVVDGAVGMQLRSVIAASRPFVEAIADDWLAGNYDRLFGEEGGQITFDQTLKYSRPTKWFYGRSLSRLLDAARRGAEHAVAWLLIAHLWDEPGYSYETILSDVAGDPAVLSEVSREIARLGQHVPADQRDVTNRALAFTQRLLTEPTSRVPAETLQGLGRWSLALQLDQATWLELTERTVQLTGGHIDYGIEVANRCADAQPSAAGLRILTATLGHGEAWDQHHIDGVGVEALRRAEAAGFVDDSVDLLRERLLQRGRRI